MMIYVVVFNQFLVIYLIIATLINNNRSLSHQFLLVYSLEAHTVGIC